MRAGTPVRLRPLLPALALCVGALPIAALAAGGTGDRGPSALNPMIGTSAAERAYVNRPRSLTAMDVTGNLAKYTGAHVAFVCEVTSVVDARQMIGQCGKAIEPVDMYVHTDTHGLAVGERLRVVGEMEPPSQWVDVTGHAWYTPFVRARYVDRLR